MLGILLVLAIVILVSGVGVSQFFQAQSNRVLAEQAAKPSARLEAVKAVGVAAAEPIAKGKAALLANPALLKAAKAPAGWVHPDDQSAE